MGDMNYSTEYYNLEYKETYKEGANYTKPNLKVVAVPDFWMALSEHSVVGSKL